MVIFVLLIFGVSSLYYAAPNTFNPITEQLSGYVPVSNNSSNITVSENTELKKSVKNNDTKKDKPKKGYSEINIGGLKTYLNTEYTNFTRIAVGSPYDSFEGDLSIDDNDSMNFIEYDDFSQLSAKNGSFNMFVANPERSSNDSNGSKYSDDLEDSINNSKTGNNSLQISSNNSTVDNIIDRAVEEYALGNISNETNITVLGNDVRIVQYIQSSDNNTSSLMSWAFFKINDTDVAIDWSGDNVDMYVIESFFKLN